MASAVAWTLHSAGRRSIFMLEIDSPLAVRRRVAFSEAVYEGRWTIQGVTAVFAGSAAAVPAAWAEGHVAVVVDSRWESLAHLRPDVVVDAVMAKRNLGTRREEASLVVGLGPGFAAGSDVHAVIETERGRDLGRIITWGTAAPDTGVPGVVAGFAAERVLRAPAAGEFRPERRIGDRVRRGDTVGTVDGLPVTSAIDGVLRGLIRGPRSVPNGLKLGDVDPRGDPARCAELSDKARTIAASVLNLVEAHAARP